MNEANGGSLRISADMTVNDVLEQSSKALGDSPIWGLYDAYKKAFEQRCEVIRTQDALIKELAGALDDVRSFVVEREADGDFSFNQVDRVVFLIRKSDAALAKVKA